MHVIDGDGHFLEPVSLWDEYVPAAMKDRIHMVPVSVEIRGQAGVDSGAGGAWSIGDAFHDAGRVLTVMAGILLISAAVLVPIGLIVGIAWLTARAVIRKRREDALE